MDPASSQTSIISLCDLDHPVLRKTILGHALALGGCKLRSMP